MERLLYPTACQANDDSSQAMLRKNLANDMKQFFTEGAFMASSEKLVSPLSFQIRGYHNMID